MNRPSTQFLRVLLAASTLALLPVSASAQFGGNAQLPEGEGRQIAEIACTTCHSLGTIQRAQGYDTPEEWRAVFGTMVELPPAQARTLSEYLAAHFPDNPSRHPTIIDGPAQVRFTEWTVPTLGQRSRDPVEAPDGSIWWTGMWASLAGRLDPETGEMVEYHLPSDARPHSIIPDADGNIWYMGNSNGTVGRLNPETGLIEEIWETEARDPHTPTWHPNGNLFFTSQRAAMIGRLDPRTGELTEVDTEPRPYGIKVAQDGTVWIAYNGTNKLGAMDPETMTIRYYDVPGERSRIRRLDIDSDGRIWYGNSTMGRIGVLDPETGEIREWPSPSGPGSHPYFMAVVDDVVWYNESGMRPDALVRFDPRTETFQSWEIPSGVGIIRHGWVTEDGNLVIHQSSSNQVGLVEILD